MSGAIDIPVAIECMLVASKRYPLISLGKILLFVLAGDLVFLELVMHIFGDIGLHAGSHLPSGIDFRISVLSIWLAVPPFWLLAFLFLLVSFEFFFRLRVGIVCF